MYRHNCGPAALNITYFTRVKRVVGAPPLLLVLLEYPVAFFLLYTQLCLSTAHWYYPLWAVTLYIVNGLLAAGTTAPKDVGAWPPVMISH